VARGQWHVRAFELFSDCCNRSDGLEAAAVAAAAAAAVGVGANVDVADLAGDPERSSVVTVAEHQCGADPVRRFHVYEVLAASGGTELSLALSAHVCIVAKLHGNAEATFQFRAEVYSAPIRQDRRCTQLSGGQIQWSWDTDRNCGEHLAVDSGVVQTFVKQLGGPVQGHGWLTIDVEWSPTFGEDIAVYPGDRNRDVLMAEVQSRDDAARSNGHEQRSGSAAVAVGLSFELSD
jgi:hypothetical protein